MKFSIITCTYNSARFIERNIKSVMSQQGDFEHIFIDGYSTDNTMEILQKYREKFGDRVHLWQSKPAGISAAMNEGIKRASGEYLIHLHSDDYLVDENVLRDVERYLSKNGNTLDWTYGQINIFDQGGEVVGVYPRRKLFQRASGRFSRVLLRMKNYIPHQAVFIKKSVFERFGFFDETLSSSMDYDFWLRIVGKTKWAYMPRQISYYCLRNDSQSASLSNRGVNEKNFFTVQERHLTLGERLLARWIHKVEEKRNKNYR